LLIPFVENAFKHVSHSGKNEIRINLARTGNIFRMKVFNTKEERPAGAGGIGLKNVRRRLELLYPGRYELDIRETADTFEIELQLKIG
jgi:LytS/YehU family sensor histidine kinase